MSKEASHYLIKQLTTFKDSGEAEMRIYDTSRRVPKQEKAVSPPFPPSSFRSKWPYIGQSPVTQTIVWRLT